jgi:hypothetical protein
MALAETKPKASQPQTGQLSVGARVGIGLFGGFCAVLLKVLAQDHVVIGGRVVSLWNGTIPYEDLAGFVGYSVLAVLIVFLGGAIGYFVKESDKFKMLMLGMSAPALFTTATGGVGINASDARQSQPPQIEAPGPAGSIFDEFRFVGTAYAGEGEEVRVLAQFSEGINLFLGRGSARVDAIARETNRYWVIVGSELDPDQAEALAESINEQAPEFEAFVGMRIPGNPYYPVIIGGEDGFLPRIEALERRDRAIDAGIAPPDSYLSDFPDRLPQMQ